MTIQQKLQVASLAIIAAAFFTLPARVEAGEVYACDQGGEGSGTCQAWNSGHTKGCYTECEAGYYACCTVSSSPQCDCVKNPSEE